MSLPDPSASYLLSGDMQQAMTAPDWLRDNVDTLVGVPLRILLIVVAMAIVRVLAKKGIKHVVKRILEPSEEREAGARPSGRGPAAVLQRDRSRAQERREQRARTIGSGRY